jgi:hypothetical protein
LYGASASDNIRGRLRAAITNAAHTVVRPGRRGFQVENNANAHSSNAASHKSIDAFGDIREDASHQ